MPQFFINKTLCVNNIITIEDEEAHHIKNVLRLNTKDWIVLSDGKGNSFEAEIVSLAKKEVVAKILCKIQKRAEISTPNFAFAIIKHDKTEYIIQKAVELGIVNLFPFFSSRTIPKYTKSINERKLQRWEKIALEAAKQSGLPFIPQIAKPQNFEDLFKKLISTQFILFWEAEKQNNFKKNLQNLDKKQNLTVIIGPEGGFSNHEVEYAKKHGTKTVSLGQQILRVETASIASLAIIQYELGNMAIK